MASGDKDDKEEPWNEYDYVRFTWADMHGIPRGVMVPRHNVRHICEAGVGAYCGMNAFGTRCQPIFPPEAVSETNANMLVYPRNETWHDLDWASDSQFKIGEVLSTCFWKDSRAMDSCSQTVLLKQMQKLDEMGLQLFSTFELEFTLYKDNKPAFQGHDMFSILLIHEFRKILLKFDHHLGKSGVSVQNLHPEYGPGQFEFVLQPQWGVKAVDNCFIAKEGIKEIAVDNGYQATFMSRPAQDISDNGLHFTFSLWDKDRKVNLFSGDNELSDLAKHFLAGLCEHGAALTAFCAPTVNCYRRFFQMLSPKTISWGMGNRFCAYRPKTYGPSGACIENRLPSGACNPYLAVAATLAAGMDGINRKLELQPEGNYDGNDGGKLPASLEEALEALEKDTVMKEALGEMVVNWFLQSKREGEIAVFPDFNKDIYRKEIIDKEFELYSKFL